MKTANYTGRLCEERFLPDWERSGERVILGV